MPSKKNSLKILKLSEVTKIIEKIEERSSNIICLYFPDVFIEKCFLTNLKEYGQYKYISCAEINEEWLSNEFLNPSLFSMGTKDLYYLGRGEVFKKNIMDYLLDPEFKNLEHDLIISFTQIKNFTTLQKGMAETTSYKVDFPKFWEGDRLIDFFAKSLCMEIVPAASAFLVNTLELQSEKYYHALEKLKLFLPNKETKVTLELCQELIPVAKLDQFELADLFSSKQYKEFFRKICMVTFDVDWFRMLCSFMQGHLFKILDPSYTDEKSKLSQYDKKIINYSSKWKSDDLLIQMREFGELEILAKRNDPLLIHEIKRRSLKY